MMLQPSNLGAGAPLAFFICHDSLKTDDDFDQLA